MWSKYLGGNSQNFLGRICVNFRNFGPINLEILFSRLNEVFEANILKG